MQRRESIQELAARIRQAAATCNLASIADTLDKALRTHFICSVKNEAVLKALFKMKADELDFHTVIQVAIQTEDAAKVAKETVYGAKSVPGLAIAQKASHQKPIFQRPPKKEVPVAPQRCCRCGNPGWQIASCWLFNDLIVSIDICNRRVAIYARSSANFSSLSWDVSVMCNSRLNSINKRGPFSANHAPFHLSCRKNWRKPTMLELLEASGRLHLSMIGEPPSFQ